MGVEKIRRRILAVEGISADDNPLEAAWLASSTASLAAKAGFMVTPTSATAVKVNGTAGGYVLGPVIVGGVASARSRIAIAGKAGIQLASSTGSTLSVALGDPLQSDNAGRCFLATTADFVVGRALTTHSSGAVASTGVALIAPEGTF